MENSLTFHDPLNELLIDNISLNISSNFLIVLYAGL